MKNGLLILLPGIRYGNDCPLLYYTRIAYEYAGYEILRIDDYEVSESDDLNAFAKLATANVVKRLKDIDFDDYSHIVFAEKSVGTLIGMMLEDELMKKKVVHLVYTPIDAVFSYLNESRIIAGIAAGTEDKHIDIKALGAACKKLDIPLISIKNAGHRLESGKDVTKDISTLAKVIASIASPALTEKLKDKYDRQTEDKAAEAAPQKSEPAEPETKADKASDQPDEFRPDPDNVRLYVPDNDKKRIADEMMEIWLQSNVKEQSFIPKKYWSKNYKEISRVLDLATVFVYEQDSHIYGFVASMEDSMVAICVDDRHRSLGIGTLLLGRMKDKMGALEASVYTKNKGAMNFFSKNEFSASDIQIESTTGEEVVLLNW